MMHAAPFAPRLTADIAFVHFNDMLSPDPITLWPHHA
jgi:hypothetical protein